MHRKTRMRDTRVKEKSLRYRCACTCKPYPDPGVSYRYTGNFSIDSSTETNLWTKTLAELGSLFVSFVWKQFLNAVILCILSLVALSVGGEGPDGAANKASNACTRPLECSSYADTRPSSFNNTLSCSNAICSILRHSRLPDCCF